jgi:hypothetical protein
MSSDRSLARSFRDLRVWQKAHEFVLAVYRYSESFPERETYGLAHQLGRAAVSRQYRRGLRQAQWRRESSFPEYRGEFGRRVPLLLDPVPRLGLRPERIVGGHLRRNQQAAQRLCAGDLGFWLLIFWLHIPKGYQGRSPWLVCCLLRLQAATPSTNVHVGTSSLV